MFKGSIEDTRTMLLMLFWCHYCLLPSYFKPFFSVFSVDFKQVNVSWESIYRQCMLSVMNQESFYFKISKSNTFLIRSRSMLRLTHFQSMILVYTPLKTSEKQRIFGVFRGYRSGTLVANGSRKSDKHFNYQTAFSVKYL